MTSQTQPTTATTTAYVIAAAIISGVTGYFIGQGSSLGLFSSSSSTSTPKKTKTATKTRSKVAQQQHNDGDASDEEEEEGSEKEEEEDYSDDEDEEDGELASFSGNTEEVKLVLVVRTDLGMNKGEFDFLTSFQENWTGHLSCIESNRGSCSCFLARKLTFSFFFC